MSGGRRAPYPEAAAAWLAGAGRQRVLDLGSGDGTFASQLHRLGHEVFCLDRDVDLVAGLPERLGTRLHVVGQVESLPYLSCHFDLVTAAATLHHFAPGLALTEIARVLKPGGHLAVVYTTRDDTVPWVKRLAALLQEVDPQAMRGEFGADSMDAVADSGYFGRCRTQELPQLGPDHPAGLVTIVQRRPAVARLERRRTRTAAGRRRAPVRHLGPGARPLAAAVPDLVLAGPG